MRRRVQCLVLYHIKFSLFWYMHITYFVINSTSLNHFLIKWGFPKSWNIYGWYTCLGLFWYVHKLLRSQTSLKLEVAHSVKTLRMWTYFWPRINAPEFVSMDNSTPLNMWGWMLKCFLYDVTLVSISFLPWRMRSWPKKSNLKINLVRFQ